MGRPSKPTSVIEAEGKSHRTKAELELRKEGEESVLSGMPLFERPEVRKNKIAHKEFLRLSKLMGQISKNDALYSAALNTYCQLYAEIREFSDTLTLIDKDAEKAREVFEELEKPNFEQVAEFVRQIAKLLSQKNAISAIIDSKRKLMFSIEKENVMTISSALRSIPKNPQDTPKNPIWSALNGANGGGDDE